LWEELYSVVRFWIERGIRIFRVDNPHTKPFAFWEWLIGKVKSKWPEVIFLSEAFTRPKPMQRLAKVGFDQSYTYFTWRNAKWELEQYLTELTKTDVGEYLRPNFWPNTPDILPEYLQYGGRAAFIVRLVLAATLSSNYGIYGPAFETCQNAALEGREEYLDAEKYEIKHWDREQPGNIRAVVERVNLARHENASLQSTRNLNFYRIDNQMMMAYGKATRDLSNITIMIVNLDPYHKQSGWIEIPLGLLGIEPEQTYLLHDALSNDKYIWQGARHYVELDPSVMPAHIFQVHRRLRKEQDFDYFM
jgi:starch synthase (maltosyl-transferring)